MEPNLEFVDGAIDDHQVEIQYPNPTTYHAPSNDMIFTMHHMHIIAEDVLHNEKGKYGSEYLIYWKLLIWALGQEGLEEGIENNSLRGTAAKRHFQRSARKNLPLIIEQLEQLYEDVGGHRGWDDDATIDKILAQ